MNNEDKMVKLPSRLGLIVWEILQKEHNIQPRKDKMEMMDFNFTEEELGLITSLNLQNLSEGDLKGISLLPNLQVLSVESKGLTSYKRPNDILSIGEMDVEEIGKCKSLQALSIVNQAKVEFLDLTDLTNLNSLTITDNSHLEEIYGINNLNDLWILNCYGNERLHHIDGLDKMILQNEDLSKVNLDLLLFPDAIGYDHLTGKYNKDSVKQLEEFSQFGDVSWCETLNGNRGIIKTNTNQMIQLHNKCCQILSENVPNSASTRDTIIGIEGYLARNVKYDDDALKNGRVHTEGSVLGTRMKVGQKDGTNSAYNALMLNSCVCEGYTRGMQYLLKLKGIASHNVYCYGVKDTTHISNSNRETTYRNYDLPTEGYHSIICIDDYDRLYDDPCWNACIYQQGDKSMPWLLKTKAEISEDHTLSFDERDTENDHLKQSRNAIQESIRSNNLFRKARLASVNNTRRQMAEQFKGQIVSREENEQDGR